MQEETSGSIIAMRSHVKPCFSDRNRRHKAMFLISKSLSISLLIKKDCKNTYIDLYRRPRDLYQHFEDYLFPTCFKKIDGVRYSCLNNSWKGHISSHISSKEKAKILDMFSLLLLEMDNIEWYYMVILSVPL